MNYSEEEARNIWNDVSPQMDQAQISRAYNHINDFVVKTRQTAIMKWSAAAVACCVAVSLFLGGIYFRKTPAAAPVFTEQIALRGETRELVLEDGTRVFLNSESSLTFAQSFTGLATRDVFLSGEAFFEVAKDAEHPFIVHAAGKAVKVTGTKFNVRAYLGEDSSTTTLLEGGVEVTVPGQQNTITLVPGQSLSVSEDNSEVSLYETSNSVGWYNGEFNAYHLTLSQICRNLERKFNVKILVSNEEAASTLCYASFVNNENVDQILSALNMQHNFRVKKQDKFYTIY